MNSGNKNNILIEALYKNKETKEFCLSNNLSENEILKNYVALSQYKDIMEVCEKCNGKSCISKVDGMMCYLELSDNKNIKVIYYDCPKQKNSNPGNLEVISFSIQELDIEITSARLKLMKYFDKFTIDYENIANKDICKGLYIWGDCGTGKSLLLYMFAKNLVAKGNTVLFAYYPDLVRQFQTSFGTSYIEDVIYRLKTADILMLDDIGRESNTSYIRDEILGPILQYRCDNKLPLFMTSNRNFKLLEEHLSETNQMVDKIKGKAIIERIKYLMQEYELVDKNYRN